MNLMNVLLSALTSGSAIKALSDKIGLPENTLRMIISIAVPLLLMKLTNNASSQNGAGSLLGALSQHRGTDSVDAQLKSADVEDGAKIIGHILGDQQDDLVKAVAAQANVNPQDVNNVLGNISPTILNGLSSATQAASQQQSAGVDLSDGFDLSDMMGLMGAASGPAGFSDPAMGLGDLLGGSSGAGDMGSLFGSLMGASQPPQEQNVNGTQLLQSLLSMM